MKYRRDKLGSWIGDKSPSVQALIVLAMVPTLFVFVIFGVIAILSGFIIANAVGELVGVVVYFVPLLFLTLFIPTLLIVHRRQVH